jgi:hypothetical protein
MRHGARDILAKEGAFRPYSGSADPSRVCDILNGLAGIARIYPWQFRSNGIPKERSSYMQVWQKSFS